VGVNYALSESRCKVLVRKSGDKADRSDFIRVVPKTQERYEWLELGEKMRRCSGSTTITKLA
jgi:hypothetical protein